MKKIIHFNLLWGILTLSLLSSCRTEDGLTQKQVEDKRFAVFVPKSGETINYANGFEFLMKRYDEIKKTNISGINNSIKNNLIASSDKGSLLFQNKGSYVEFKVRSQVVTEENGEKWVIFPKVENNQVIGLIMSTLKEKETLIAFDEIKNSSEYYKQLLPLFQEAFNRYNRRKTSLALSAGIKPMAIGGEGAEPGGSDTDCGADVQKCGKIEEVIVPGKPKQPVTPPTVPIGVSSCWDIANCPIDPGSEGGGGGAPFPNQNQQDPCSKMKGKIATERGRAIIKDLEVKAKIHGNPENAYRQDKNGDTKMYVGEQDNVLIPIDNNMEGVYHDHPPGGVNMLSVKDIRMMLFAARMQSDDNIGNAFVGMISDSGNYFVSFNGTKADIPVIYDSQISDLRQAYDRDYLEISMFLSNGQKPSSEQLEQLFFKTIDNMGLTGKVNLIKEKDGSTSEVKQNANGTPVTLSPC